MTTHKFQFTTEGEKQNIINAHPDLILREEQYITEGNFLIFADIPSVENQLQDIKNSTDMILLKQEGII